MIKERRKARRTWQRNRYLIDKRDFNQLRQMINDFMHSCLESYLKGLSPSADRNYLLWKVTCRFKRPTAHIYPIRNVQNECVRRNDKKDELFAQHLATVFYPNYIHSTINLMYKYKPEVSMKLVSLMEMA